jgi:hypothetical protein
MFTFLFLFFFSVLKLGRTSHHYNLTAMDFLPISRRIHNIKMLFCMTLSVYKHAICLGGEAKATDDRCYKQAEAHITYTRLCITAAHVLQISPSTYPVTFGLSLNSMA